MESSETQRVTTTKTGGRLTRWYCERFHRLAGPWQDEGGYYQRCLDCGRRIAWVDPFPLRGPSLRSDSR